MSSWLYHQPVHEWGLLERQFVSVCLKFIENMDDVIRLNHLGGDIDLDSTPGHAGIGQNHSGGKGCHTISCKCFSVSLSPWTKGPWGPPHHRLGWRNRLSWRLMVGWELMEGLISSITVGVLVRFCVGSWRSRWRLCGPPVIVLPGCSGICMNGNVFSVIHCQIRWHDMS